MGIDTTLVCSSLTNILSSLIVDLDTIETNVKEVTMGRVQVELEQEAHRHGDWLRLLKELDGVGLGVEASLDGYDLLVSPSKQKWQLY